MRSYDWSRGLNGPVTLQTMTLVQAAGKKLVVIGGNGFVGSHVCRAALRMGISVTSVNRSGSPKPSNGDIKGVWQRKVEWVQADVFDRESWAPALKETAGVVSCVGAFGTNEFMERICGDANIIAAAQSKDSGVERFVFISSTGFDPLPSAILRGYREGKGKAEAAVKELYPETGVSIRAPFMYGNRGGIPLQLVGIPLKGLFSLPPFSLLNWNIMAPPASVESVATAAVLAAISDVNDYVTDDRVMERKDIETVASLPDNP